VHNPIGHNAIEFPLGNIALVAKSDKAKRLSHPLPVTIPETPTKKYVIDAIFLSRKSNSL
jgi:hypothetical protein